MPAVMCSLEHYSIFLKPYWIQQKRGKSYVGGRIAYFGGSVKNGPGLLEIIAEENVFVAVPWFGADVDIAVAVHVGRLGFVAAFAA